MAPGRFDGQQPLRQQRLLVQDPIHLRHHGSIHATQPVCRQQGVVKAQGQGLPGRIDPLQGQGDGRHRLAHGGLEGSMGIDRPSRLCPRLQDRPQGGLGALEQRFKTNHRPIALGVCTGGQQVQVVAHPEGQSLEGMHVIPVANRAHHGEGMAHDGDAPATGSSGQQLLPSRQGTTQARVLQGQQIAGLQCSQPGLDGGVAQIIQPPHRGGIHAARQGPTAIPSAAITGQQGFIQGDKVGRFLKTLRVIRCSGQQIGRQPNPSLLEKAHQQGGATAMHANDPQRFGLLKR
jgi:hypothetical protein